MTSKSQQNMPAVLADSEVKTAFNIFGSDLPDEVFAGVFEHARQRDWRKLDL
jgi:hypothetical protein